MDDIVEVSEKSFLHSVIETRIPLGNYICQDGEKFVAVDNKTGDSWTEEFDTKEEAIGWLKGFIDLY